MVYKSEVRMSQSTGVDSSRSWRFSTGSRAGPGVILNRSVLRY